jgi:hypothetical protein
MKNGAVLQKTPHGARIDLNVRKKVRMKKSILAYVLRVSTRGLCEAGGNNVKMNEKM